MAPSQECTTQSEYEMAPIEEWVVVSKRRKHNVFLSHSGGQKDFAEQLCVDLEQAKQFPFFDKRLHSLPKGVEFAQRIFTAVQECEIAVVVLSQEYFTRSKWPMLELVAILQAPGCKVLPLFFGLSCKEFKKPKRRKHWFQVWDEWSQSDNRICVDVWKDALKELDRRNGMEYVKALGEVVYRKDVVTTVIDMVHCRPHAEIVVVEGAASHAHNGLQQPGTVARRQKGSLANSQPTCLIAILVAVLLIVIVLLYYGYGRCPHVEKEIPTEQHNLANVSLINCSLPAHMYTCGIEEPQY